MGSSYYFSKFRRLSQVTAGRSIAYFAPMRTIIVVATCKKISKTQGVGEFSFSGYYAGEFIRRLKVLGKGEQKWEKNEDYVMHVEVLLTDRECLVGQVLKTKKLSEIFSQN